MYLRNADSHIVIAISNCSQLVGTFLSWKLYLPFLIKMWKVTCRFIKWWSSVKCNILLMTWDCDAVRWWSIKSLLRAFSSMHYCFLYFSAKPLPVSGTQCRRMWETEWQSFAMVAQSTLRRKLLWFSWHQATQQLSLHQHSHSVRTQHDVQLIRVLSLPKFV